MMDVFIVISSMMLFLSRSPFFMSINLIVFSICWSVLVFLYSMDWFFYTLIIMFLGGMMVMFTYASSLASIFKIHMLDQTRLLISLLIFASALSMSFSWCGLPLAMSSSTWMIYFWPSTMFTMFMVLVTIMALFVVVKLVLINEGPLKMN